jgi:Ca-activated chloride channel family protein
MAQRNKALTLPVGLIAAIPLLLAGPAAAQVAGPLPPGRSLAHDTASTIRPIQVDVAMVLVSVTVTDFQDRPLTDLQKNDFRIFEDDVEQEILTFSHEDAPISIGLLFDMSGSMVNKVEKARRAALQVLKTANPQDEFFLVTFGNRARLTSDFTSDIEELEDRMLTVKPDGKTALLDAISLGMEQMKAARNRKRALVIISDGGDNHSRTNETRVRSALREADCQVYAMGIFDEAVKTREERDGPSLLAEFADFTGGRSFPVSSPDELAEIADKISVELRDRYVLGYKPDTARRDGAWRAIKVKVAETASPLPLRILARTGYYSAKD